MDNASAIEHDGAPILIERSTLSGTTSAPVVRAERARNCRDSEFTILDSTIAGNALSAGDTLIASSGYDVSVERSAIAANSGTPDSSVFSLGVSGCVDSAGALSVKDSILSSNGGASVVAGAASVEYSVVPVGADLGATNVEADDAGLNVPGDNGGTTRTLVPNPGSPARGAGSDSAVEYLTDQRGFARPVGRIDVGAVQADAAEVDGGQITIRPMLESVPFGAETAEFIVERSEPAIGSASATVSALAVINQINAVDSAEIDLAVDLVAFGVTSGAEWFGTQYPNLGAFSSPRRVLGTRDDTPIFDDGESESGRIRPSEVPFRLQVAGRRGPIVLLGARAVVAYITAVRPDDVGFVTAYSCDDGQPLASSLNYVPGVNGGNEVLVELSGRGEICLAVSSPVHITVDIVGQMDGY